MATTALTKVLSLFTPPDKIKVADYKSYSYLRTISNQHSIKLMYGYSASKNPIWSNSVKFKSLTQAYKVLEILEEGLISNKTANLDFLDEPENNNDEVVTTRNEDTNLNTEDPFGEDTQID